MDKNAEIGLFIPFYIDQFYPHVGIATLQFLQKLGLNIVYPAKQTCCGQPLANSGCEDEAIKVYNNFVRNFSRFDYVVCPSGSCVYHIREHYDILQRMGCSILYYLSINEKSLNFQKIQT